MSPDGSARENTPRSKTGKTLHSPASISQAQVPRVLHHGRAGGPLRCGKTVARGTTATEIAASDSHSTGTIAQVWQAVCRTLGVAAA
ncbi:hypothetical protein FNF31_07376 [Cafeteria roenbergensis]|uniref:Uncharacterized protein n=1 Tax=Cafeteria roenbergensis TaxID=33653 RepID=A0A5A8C6C6_CAFRO|nr:hypothetical protein FNF31_07376 [Cafeteria roenbergensis]